MQSNLPMLVLVFLAQCATAGDNWPQFRGPVWSKCYVAD